MWEWTGSPFGTKEPQTLISTSYNIEKRITDDWKVKHEQVYKNVLHEMKIFYTRRYEQFSWARKHYEEITHFA